MKVVILCGGLGTRLREETEYRPKPMVPVGDRPVVWHIMNRYAAFGFKEFILCLGYKGEQIQDYFLHYQTSISDFTLRLDGHSTPQFHDANRETDWSVTFARTGQSAMTGARVKRIERYITEDAFLLTYGDGLADVDFAAQLRFHRGHGRIGTVTGVHPGTGRFGELMLRGNEVVRFTEKPDRHDGYINGGFFIFQRDIFKYLRDDDRCVLEHEPLQGLAQDGQLMSYFHDGYWACMDTYRDYQQLNEIWKSGRAPWAGGVPPSAPARSKGRRAAPVTA